MSLNGTSIANYKALAFLLAMGIISTLSSRVTASEGIPLNYCDVFLTMLPETVSPERVPPPWEGAVSRFQTAMTPLAKIAVSAGAYLSVGLTLYTDVVSLEYDNSDMPEALSHCIHNAVPLLDKLGQHELLQLPNQQILEQEHVIKGVFFEFYSYWQGLGRTLAFHELEAWETRVNFPKGILIRGKINRSRPRKTLCKARVNEDLSSIKRKKRKKFKRTLHRVNSLEECMDFTLTFAGDHDVVREYDELSKTNTRLPEINPSFELTLEGLNVKATIFALSEEGFPKALSPTTELKVFHTYPVSRLDSRHRISYDIDK